MSTGVVFGSRGSKLALTQTQWVIDLIKTANPDLEVRIEVIKTQGDRVLDVPLAKIGDKGLFVKEIEFALLHGMIDVAIHSMKDLPTEEPEGLVLGAVPEREDPADVLLSSHWSLGHLPHGAKIGSSSLRRRAQLLHFRQDLEVQDLRGNLDTRIQRLENGDFDAVILAAAGLNRLGWQGRRERIPFDISLPAVGQGALAVQCRGDDHRIINLLQPLDHAETRAAILAERSLMRALQGGCQIPIGALARLEDESLRLDAMVADIFGKRLIRRSGCATIKDAGALGMRVAQELLDAGAEEILEELRESQKPTSTGAAG